MDRRLTRTRLEADMPYGTGTGTGKTMSCKEALPDTRSPGLRPRIRPCSQEAAGKESHPTEQTERTALRESKASGKPSEAKVSDPCSVWVFGRIPFISPC